MAGLRCRLTTCVICFQPLPDSQYNGNPESVGYRIGYWRPDLQAPVLAQVINDRLEREFTIEGLEEWTEYELQMQAFNAIGAGPWSETVRGRTRESGEVEAQPQPGSPWRWGSVSPSPYVASHCSVPTVSMLTHS